MKAANVAKEAERNDCAASQLQQFWLDAVAPSGDAVRERRGTSITSRSYTNNSDLNPPDG